MDWELDIEELLELWRENRSDILQWLSARHRYRGGGLAGVLPNGKSFYHSDFSTEALDVTNFEAVEDHFDYIEVDLQPFVGDYEIELPTIFNVSEDPEDLELGAVCAFFWNLDRYMERVYPLLNEDHFDEMISEEQERRASEDAESFTDVDEWLTNFGSGYYNLDYTGYGHKHGERVDICADYVQELAMDARTGDWRELAYRDRMNYYDYYGIDG